MVVQALYKDALGDSPSCSKKAENYLGSQEGYIWVMRRKLVSISKAFGMFSTAPAISGKLQENTSPSTTPSPPPGNGKQYNYVRAGLPIISRVGGSLVQGTWLTGEQGLDDILNHVMLPLSWSPGDA